MEIPTPRLIDPSEEFNLLTQDSLDYRSDAAGGLTEVFTFELDLSGNSIPATGVIHYSNMPISWLRRPDMAHVVALMPNGFYPDRSVYETTFEIQVPRYYSQKLFQDIIQFQINYPMPDRQLIHGEFIEEDVISTFIASGRPDRLGKDTDWRTIRFLPFMMTQPAVKYAQRTSLYLPADHDALMKKATGRIIVG